MSPVTQILICACAVFALLDTVTAIECYSCDSATSPDTCGDDFSDTNTITKDPLTNAECKFCIKAKAKTDGIFVINRDCSSELPENYPHNKCDTVKFGGVSGDVCTCSGDKCNGVGKVSCSLFVILAVTMFKYLI